MTVLKDGRDIYYVCVGCGGNLIVIKEENGRKTFNCDRCRANECPECTICHKPRSVWADDGDICWLCAIKYLEGKLSLTPVQVAGIEKWRVVVY